MKLNAARESLTVGIFLNGLPHRVRPENLIYLILRGRGLGGYQGLLTNPILSSGVMTHRKLPATNEVIRIMPHFTIHPSQNVSDLATVWDRYFLNRQLEISLSGDVMVNRKLRWTRIVRIQLYVYPLVCEVK
jgi:hypothetical protein